MRADGRAHRRTDTTKLINIFRNSACAPKNLLGKEKYVLKHCERVEPEYRDLIWNLKIEAVGEGIGWGKVSFMKRGREVCHK